MKKAVKYFSLVVICSLTFTKRAYAYLDPGSGSYLIQILIASFAGGGLLLKSQWKEIIARFFKKKDKNSRR